MSHPLQSTVAILATTNPLGRLVGAHGPGVVLRFMGRVLLAVGVQMGLSGVIGFASS